MKNSSVNWSALTILCLLASVVGLMALLAFNKPHKGKVLFQGKGKAKAAIEWKMATSWPKGFPGIGTAPDYFASQVDSMSQGRLKIKVYAANEIVPALGVFDAVANGSVEVGHSAAYYWKGKSKATPFFSTVPFGMTAQEMNAWLYYGGGLSLWRELYADFNLYPLAAGNTGVQMAGWFNKEINTIADIQGLKMRIPGLAGDVFTRAGGTAVNIAAGDLYTALKTGVIDAVEWVGPYNDLAIGFYEVARYYYYPGWHEPGSTMELVVNREAFLALPVDLQAIVETAAIAANQLMLSEYTARNHHALQEMINKHHVQLKALPQEVLDVFKEHTHVVINEIIADDPMAKRIYQSYQKFSESVKSYHAISEQAYMNTRSRTLDTANSHSKSHSD